jgi:DNA-binding NarL/FixJ family response regulator
MNKSATSPVRILLVDDHELFRNGIASLIDTQDDMEVIGEAGDGIEAHYRAVALVPDLILLDINMPGGDGLEAVKLIRSDLPDTTIIMLTVHDEDDKVFSAIQSGANGYILKNTNSNQFLPMLRGILKGDAPLSPKLTGKIWTQFSKRSEQTSSSDPPQGIIPLTPREKEVLTCVSEGLSDKEISNSLSISIYTVKSHVRNILSKLNVENRYTAAEYAREIGLIQPEKQ